MSVRIAQPKGDGVMTPALGKNPLRAGVGIRPVHLAGRDPQMRRFRAMLRAAPEQPANMRLTGLRGVGKSVLLGEFEDIAKQNGWASALLELQPGHNTDEALVTALIKTAALAKEQLSRMERLRKAVGKTARRAGTLGVGWGEFVLTYAPFAEQAQEDLSKALFEVV